MGESPYAERDVRPEELSVSSEKGRAQDSNRDIFPGETLLVPQYPHRESDSPSSSVQPEAPKQDYDPVASPAETTDYALGELEQKLAREREQLSLEMAELAKLFSAFSESCQRHTQDIQTVSEWQSAYASEVERTVSEITGSFELARKSIDTLLANSLPQDPTGMEAYTSTLNEVSASISELCLSDASPSKIQSLEDNASDAYLSLRGRMEAAGLSDSPYHQDKLRYYNELYTDLTDLKQSIRDKATQVATTLNVLREMTKTTQSL